MKRTKILLALMLCVAVIVSVTACGEPYSNIKFEEYIKVGDYESNINKAKETVEKNQKDAIWSELVSNVKMKTKKNSKGKEVELYPQKELDRVKKETEESYKKYAKDAGLDFKEFLKKEMNMDEKTFNKRVEEYAKLVVKEELVIYYIAYKEGIKVSKEEYNKYIKDTLKKYGHTEDSYKKETGKTYEEAIGKENIKKAIYKEKILGSASGEGKDK